MNSTTRAICDQLRRAQRDGWRRTGSDLDGLSARDQRQLAEAVRTTIQRTTADHKFHSCKFGGTDDTGRWSRISGERDIGNLRVVKINLVAGRLRPPATP